MALPEEATEIDEIFPEEDELDADDILAASSDEIEDFYADDDIEIVPAEVPPIGRNWAFDFENGRFFADGRSPMTVRGDTALIAWIEKCLRTQQGSSIVHPPDYGLAQSLSDYLGTVADETDLPNLESDIHEALTFHPLIESVEGFEVFFGPSLDESATTAEISFTVILGDGTELPFDAELEVEAAV